LKRLIVCADDFGLDTAVNEAVAIARRDGILTCASLMVGAPAVADAVARARQDPALRVGLHIVLADGRAVLPPSEIPDLVDGSGAFDDNMARAGVRFFFLPRVRRQLAREIRAQFEAFRATGLALDHANAHKHFHLHPTIAALIIRIGRDYGLKAVRVPAEPMALLHRAGLEPVSLRARIGTILLALWSQVLRRQLRRAGLAANDHLLGLTWTGAMTAERVAAVLPRVPDGVSEMYFHPATSRTAALRRAMPDYRHEAELAALVSAAAIREIAAARIELISYSDLVAESAWSA
jgi:hopanoid biosynthesis associated protein HpnK